MFTKTKSTFTIIFFGLIISNVREIFCVILKVNNTDFEYSVSFQNNTIRRMDAHAFSKQLIQIPR